MSGPLAGTVSLPAPLGTALAALAAGRVPAGAGDGLADGAADDLADGLADWAAYRASRSARSASTLLTSAT